MDMTMRDWAPKRKLGGGWLCFKDSPSAPAAPDYTGAANATAAGNLEAARAAAAANRVNQVTPYGNLTYSHAPQGFDQSSYDAAMADYQKKLDAYNAYQQTSTSNGTAPNNGIAGQLSAVFGGQMDPVTGKVMTTAPIAPDRSQYMIGSPDDGWTATTSLTPEQQQILNQNTALTTGLLSTAQKGLSSVDALLANPTLDQSKLPSTMINPGESYIDASMRLMQPNFDRQRSMFGTQMANQGIPTSSEAYRAGDSDLSDNQNRAMLQAIQTGMAGNQTARQQAIQEQTYEQDRPLNVVNALRTGNQVQGPQFVNVPQQATTQGADLLGAMQGQSQYDQGLYNSQAAAASSGNQATAGALGTIATAAAIFF